MSIIGTACAAVVTCAAAGIVKVLKEGFETVKEWEGQDSE
jgi:hypothetical protein